MQRNGATIAYGGLRIINGTINVTDGASQLGWSGTTAGSRVLTVSSGTLELSRQETPSIGRP